jgi:hypothetical protein
VKKSSWIVLVVVLLVIGLVGLELLAQGADPLLGTWELNLAKSKIRSDPPPKSDTRTFAQEGDGVKFTLRAIDANGKPVLIEYTAKYDGKDYPVTGNPDSDTISMKRIDRFTTESTQKRGGKIVWTNKRVVSADGKTSTLTSHSTNANGETVTNVLVFDKK